MKVKGLVIFRSKLLKPCKSFFSIFKFKLKKPLIIRALWRPRPIQKNERNAPRRNRITRLLSLICSSKMPKETDQLAELQSTSTVERERLLHPSPITPAYIKKAAKKKKRASQLDVVEDACRSFENYLMEMVIDEGKLSDLKDVEELLYCSMNLKSPIFIELICRFYGELCKDLFAPDGESSDTGK